MANVNVKFNGKDFLLSCEDGQEEHLEELANNLNNKFEELKSDLGNIGENKLLLITAIKVMDEYFETKKKIDQKIEELNDLTKKFKELKSLVYEYKDKKDNEISNLNLEQKKIKNQLDENKLNYENVIEKTTDEIKNFLTKIDTESPLQ